MEPVSPVMPGSESIEVIYGESQPEYIPVPGVYLDTPAAPVLTRWRFSDEERAQIVAGADLVLTVLRFRRKDGTPRPLSPVHLQVSFSDEMPVLVDEL